MATDADTILASDAVAKLVGAFDDPGVAAACGFVLPRFVKTIWERGRYIESMLAFTWYKPIQDYYDKPLISSGCLSMYRTGALREAGCWSTRTLAEDMALTWTFSQRGYRVRFVNDDRGLCLRDGVRQGGRRRRRGQAGGGTGHQDPGVEPP